MARTVIDMPTVLPDHEVGAKVASFLLNNRFQKVFFRGEEVYRLGALLLRPGYLKVQYGSGTVHIEAWYVTRWGDQEIGYMGDPYDLRKKLVPLCLELGLSQTGDDWDRARQELRQERMSGQATQISSPSPQRVDAAPAYGAYPPSGTGYGGTLDPHAQDEKRAARRKGWKQGCLITILIFVALFAGCTALVLWYPLPEKTDSPAVRESTVSRLGWETYDHVDYRVRYPNDWEVIDLGVVGNFAPKDKSSAGMIIGFMNDVDATYDAIDEENFIGKVLDEKYLGFSFDEFAKGEMGGRRVIYALARGPRDDETVLLYCYLVEIEDKFMWVHSILSEDEREAMLPVIDAIVSSIKIK